MKKIFSILILTFLVSGFSQAQFYKPNMQLIVKGVINAPFYDPISENTAGNAFIGVQVEPVINLSSHWGIFGTFNAGFIPSKDIARELGTGTFQYSKSSEISGYVGPRYYFAPEDGKYLKVYVDAGIGAYSFNPSDAVFTSNTNPAYTKTFTFPGSTQIGMNLGGGLNVNLSPSVFLNFGARFHNLFQKSAQQLTSTVVYNNGTPTEETTVTQDIPNRNYLQMTAGIGFRFGL